MASAHLNRQQRLRLERGSEHTRVTVSWTCRRQTWGGRAAGTPSQARSCDRTAPTPFRDPERKFRERGTRRRTAIPVTLSQTPSDARGAAWWSGGVVASGEEEGAVQLHEAQPGPRAHGLDHTQGAILFFAWPESPFPFSFSFCSRGSRAKHSWGKGQG